MQFDDVQIGGQLRVGTGVYRAIKEGWQRINGSAAIEGPVVLGDQEDFGKNEATLMVGKNSNKDVDCINAKFISENILMIPVSRSQNKRNLDKIIKLFD